MRSASRRRCSRRRTSPRWYPDGVRGFEGTPGAIIPRYAGNSKHEWRIGETTDDTERTIAVARAIISERNVSHAGIGREMLGCRKCVHPGVKSLWEFHQAGDPDRIATQHDGCGAAIRVAPVGIFHAPDRSRRAREQCARSLHLHAWRFAGDRRGRSNRRRGVGRNRWRFGSTSHRSC